MALAIGGPALTTCGAALLTYDVLRGPARFLLEAEHVERLDVAEHDRKDAIQTLKSTVADGTAGMQKVEVAATVAHHTAVVRAEVSSHADAGAVDRARAFRLGIAGLVLVGLGGVAETVAALIEAFGHQG